MLDDLGVLWYCYMADKSKNATSRLRSSPIVLLDDSGSSRYCNIGDPTELQHDLEAI